MFSDFSKKKYPLKGLLINVLVYSVGRPCRSGFNVMFIFLLHFPIVCIVLFLNVERKQWEFLAIGENNTISLMSYSSSGV